MKELYLEGRQILEREITFEEFKEEVEEYFLLHDKDIKQVNISLNSPLTENGVSYTFNNKVDIEEKGLYKCFVNHKNGIILEFSEFTQSIFINEKANITLDFHFNRIFIKDLNMCIHFNRSK